MTRLELFALMREIVMIATGVPEAILADDNHTAPGGEYASIEPFQLVNSYAKPYIRSANSGSDDVSQTIEGNAIVECPINFYRGGDSRGRALALKNAPYRTDIMSKLFRAGVGWQSVGPVNNLSSLQSSRTEQRSNVSVFLMFKDVTTVTLNAILSAPIRVEYADGTVVYEES